MDNQQHLETYPTLVVFPVYYCGPGGVVLKKERAASSRIGGRVLARAVRCALDRRQ